MRIGYFADGPWSHKALEHIERCDQLEIVFIVPRFDTQDPVLKEWSEKFHIPFLPNENVNDSGFIQELKGYEADIYVSMSFNQILKKEIIDSAPKGFINCHAGALPFYRGRNPLNWVLINGEKEFGITVHYVDEGIDTGDIIEQELYPIGPNENYGDLLDKAIIGCADVLYRALVAIDGGCEKRLLQSDIHKVGTYFGIRKLGDEWLDFEWPSQRIHNFVRAIACPGPGARTYAGGREYAILRSVIIEGAPDYIATCGEVLGKTPQGVVVKSGDNTILLTAMAEVIDGHVQNIFTPKFKVGTRFYKG